jgi:hypothetical protein
VKTVFWFNCANFAGKPEIGEFDFAKPLELFGDDRSFQFALMRDLDMLEVASAATIWPSKITWGRDAVRGWLENLDNICPSHLRSDRRDLNDDAFTGDRVAHEENLTFMASDEMATMGCSQDIDSDAIAHF